jgi:hypothetical protein
MPRVPTSQETVRAQPLQGPVQSLNVTPDMLGANRMRPVAEALNSAADAAQRIKDRNDADEVFRHEAEIRADYIQFESSTKQSRRADQAKGVTNDVDKWWSQQASDRVNKITDPRQKHLLGQTVTRLRLQSLDSFRGFEDAQGEISHDTNWQASKDLIASQAAADPKTVPTAIVDIQQKNAYYAARKGLSATVHDALNLKDTTALHSNVIKQLVTSDPTAAKAYFDANKKQIHGANYDEITKLVDSASAASDGEKAAGAAWDALGPKSYNDPVLLDQMEKAVREQYPNDAHRSKAAIGALRERVAAHNSTQAEVKADSINKVMGVYEKTRSLTALQKTPEWQNLAPPERLKVEDYIASHQTAAIARSNAADERSQRALQRRGMGAYLAYSNPDTLSRMSEAQVQALLPDLGNDLTNHLMEKKRGQASAEAKTEAKVDADDFNATAARMGLKPYDNGKSDSEKADLGELKFRVEQLIDSAQRIKKGPLTRPEKNELMAQEIAKTVSVSGFWSNTDKPVVTLTPKELTQINVPANDRAQIIEAMRSRYAQSKDPRYAPTEANVKRWYAVSKSRSAALIPDAK